MLLASVLLGNKLGRDSSWSEGTPFRQFYLPEGYLFVLFKCYDK